MNRFVTGGVVRVLLGFGLWLVWAGAAQAATSPCHANLLQGAPVSRVHTAYEAHAAQEDGGSAQTVCGAVHACCAVSTCSVPVSAVALFRPAASLFGRPAQDGATASGTGGIFRPPRSAQG